MNLMPWGAPGGNAPLWVTVTVCPPIVIVPIRWLGVELAATV
jgi:hypothetical protein